MWKTKLRRLAFEWRRVRRMAPATLARKAVLKLLGLMLGLLLLPVTVLLHLAGYRHVTIFTDRIGHLALEPDCLLKEQALGHISRRKWIMLAPPGRVANEHLLTYWQPHFRIVRSRTACFFIASMSRWGLMRYRIDHYVRAIGKDQVAYRIYADWGSRPPLLQLTAEDDAWGSAMMARMGVPDGAWYVCVHAREAGFSPVDEELHGHRNSHIENTMPAMQEIVRRGGWAIRIGDPTMHPLPPARDVIDYAHYPLKSDRLDVVLCAKARFLLGNTSGVASLSSVFGVPGALTNMIPVSSLGFSKGDISIPKLIRSKRLDRYVRLDELLGSEAANYQYAALYEAHGLQVIENSPDDIHDLVCEMLDCLDGRFEVSREDEARLLSVAALFNRYHYAYGSAARISISFLRKHPELLPPP
ncbi:MAG: TIGR04372 family glycosyltransferase [Proteobacteria bacterium]|nr:TIGR04372 family glycosyltransferase [Pseudomonadota bacterium]